MSEKLIIIGDVELTCLKAKEDQSSLITAFLGIVNSKDELIDELDLKLVPDEGYFTVSPESMAVNQIDLRGWTGITYSEARPLIGKFLRKYVYDENHMKTGELLRPIGHGINGDIKMLQKHIISEASWLDCVDRISHDSCQLASILREKGLLKIDSLKLTALAEYFGFDTTDAHTAKADSLLAYKVFRQLEKLGLKNG